MLPKISKEALKEACKIIPVNSSNKISEEDYNKALQKMTDTLKKDQPQLVMYLAELVKFHMLNFEGVCPAASIFVYIAIILESLKIQEEIDKLDDLFKSS